MVLKKKSSGCADMFDELVSPVFDQSCQLRGILHTQKKIESNLIKKEKKFLNKVEIR